MNPEDLHANEDDEYLTRVVIDTCARTFYMQILRIHSRVALIV